MNTSRTKEYILVTAVNILFAFYTLIFLNGVPYISLHIVTTITYLAACGWFLYGCSLYMILKWDNTHSYGLVRHILASVAIKCMDVRFFCNNSMVVYENALCSGRHRRNNRWQYHGCELKEHKGIFDKRIA